MGFYCETVQKLRYKGFYHPTQILDRFTMNYFYLKDVQQILKERKFIQLSKNMKKIELFETNMEENKKSIKNNLKFKLFIVY